MPTIIIKSSSDTCSLNTCLHTPHGKHGSTGSVPRAPPTIAIAVKFFSPSLIAFDSATRSAQMLGEKTADSILQPL